MISFPVPPMKATLATLPSDAEDAAERWAYEIKWDGHRTIAHVDGPRTRLQTTSGLDSSDRWPEVTALAGSINATSAVIDGEMLVVDEDGRPRFDLVQRRDPSRHAAVFHAFDVLRIDGTETIDLGYLDRRALLAQLVESGDHWTVPGHHLGNGAALLASTVEQRLEGLIAKRTDSPYRPGARSKDWLKIKNRTRVDVVIGGWTTGTGARSSTFGSLLVGVQRDGVLRFAGGVGTGFTQATLDALGASMADLASDVCPFDPAPPAAVRRNARWVRPELTATIEIAEFTNDGQVRHASYVRLAP